MEDEDDRKPSAKRGNDEDDNGDNSSRNNANARRRSQDENQRDDMNDTDNDSTYESNRRRGRMYNNGHDIPNLPDSDSSSSRASSKRPPNSNNNNNSHHHHHYGTSMRLIDDKHDGGKAISGGKSTTTALTTTCSDSQSSISSIGVRNISSQMTTSSNNHNRLPNRRRNTTRPSRQLYHMQLQLLAKFSGISVLLFFFFFLNFFAFAALMSTGFSLVLFGITFQNYIQYLIENDQLNLFDYLPNSIQELMTTQTIHDSFISAAPPFQESRFLLLYFIPGLSTDQLNRLIGRLPQRQQEMARDPGGLARFLLPPSVYNVLAPPDAGVTTNRLSSTTAAAAPSETITNSVPQIESIENSTDNINNSITNNNNNNNTIMASDNNRLLPSSRLTMPTTTTATTTGGIDDLHIEANPSELTTIEEGDEQDTITFNNNLDDDDTLPTVRDALQGIVQTILPVSEEVDTIELVLDPNNNNGGAFPNPMIGSAESNDLSWDMSFDHDEYVEQHPQEQQHLPNVGDSRDMDISIMPSEDSRIGVRVVASHSGDDLANEQKMDSEDEDSDIGIEINSDAFTGNLNEGRLQRLSRFLGLGGGNRTVDTNDDGTRSDNEEMHNTETVNDNEERSTMPPTTVTARTTVAIPTPPPAQPREEPARSAEEIEEDRIVQDQIIEDAFSEMVNTYTSIVTEQATSAVQYMVESIVPSVIRAGLAMSSLSGIGLAGFYSSGRLASSSLLPPPGSLGRGLAEQRDSRAGQYVTAGLLSTLALGLVSVGSSMLVRHYVRRMSSHPTSDERMINTSCPNDAPDIDEVSDDESDDDK